MDKAISLAILAAGIMLVVFGINASNSIISDISRVFPDTQTDKAIWMPVGGVGVTIIGVAGLMRGLKR